MARPIEHGRSRGPVIVAVAATMTVCGFGHFAYNRFVLAHASAPASKGGEPVPEGPESAPPRAFGQNCEMGAALLRALAAAKTEKTREECKPKSAPSEANQAAADDRDAEGLSESARRFMKGNVETLEAEFRDEKVDVDWAKKTEEAATRAVASATTGMRLEEVTCRTTFCRARVTHVDPSMRGTDMMQLLGSPEMSTQMLPYAPAEDEATTVIYFARQGHTLSVLSSAPPPSSPAAGASDLVQTTSGGLTPPKNDSQPPTLAGG